VAAVKRKPSIHMYSHAELGVKDKKKELNNRQSTLDWFLRVKIWLEILGK